MDKLFLAISFLCLTVVLAGDRTPRNNSATTTSRPGGRTTDQSSLCRAVADGSCDSFKTCCRSKCPSPNRLSCNPSDVSLTNASCVCERQRLGPFTAVPGGHLEDYSSPCSLLANGSCNSFRTCCISKCKYGPPYRLNCSSSGATLTNAVCDCPPPAIPVVAATSPSGSSHGTTTKFRETVGEEDFTNTCTRHYHDCTSFRACCTNVCGDGFINQVQCEERGGQMKNTMCKCRIVYSSTRTYSAD